MGAPAAQAQELPFSANDLAILFPLDSQKGYLPKQRVGVGSSAWKIISEEQFSSVIAQAKKSGVYISPDLGNSKNWYVVGMRYAPCTIFAGPKPLCKEQIRLILQPYGAEGSAAGFHDYAMHVVFEYGQREKPLRTPILEGFRNIKNQFGQLTLNQPVEVHPVLSSENANAYFEALEKEVIAKFINTRFPSKVTFVGLGAVKKNEPDAMPFDADHWVFFSGDVDAKGRWSLTDLPTGTGAKTENLKVEGEDGEGGLKSDFKARKGQFNLFAKQVGAETPWIILDEHRTNDHNVNCASCHAADGYAFPIGVAEEQRLEDFRAGMKSLFENSPRLTEVLVDDSIHTGRQAAELPIMRAFGYLDRRPLVSQRLVNANAIAVQQANELLGLSVDKQCESPAARQEVFSCLYLNETPSTLQLCLQKFCK